MEEYLYFLFVFFCGASFGSCASLLSYRLPLDQDVFFTRSKCPKCKKALGIKDLFPILSWLFSAGKCRYCKTEIHIRYPLSEIVTGLLFMISYFYFGVTISTILICLLSFILVTMCVTDFEHYIVPDSLQIAALIIAIIWGINLHYKLMDFIIPIIVTLFFGFALKYIFMWIRKKDGLGIADIKFFAIAAIFLNLNNFVIFLFLGGVIGVVFGIIWQKIIKSKIFPFIPALSASLFLCLIIPPILGKSWSNSTEIISILIN